jgi:hypothetical protein
MALTLEHSKAMSLVRKLLTNQHCKQAIILKVITGLDHSAFKISNVYRQDDLDLRAINNHYSW